MEYYNKEKFPNTVVIRKNGKTVFLIGTAHVSKESKEEVKTLIDEVNPDSVAVELCESRYNSLKNKDKWKNLDIIQVLKRKQGFLLFTNMILSAFQKKAGISLDSAPGEEMLGAIEKAEEKKAAITLADRDINITLKRAWRLSSFANKLKIMGLLIDSLFANEKIEDTDIDELMKEDILNNALDTFAAQLPAVKKVLIDERNEFIANKILSSEGNVIVAVVGKGHLNGIVNIMENDVNIDIENINFVPKAGIVSKLLPWSITLIILTIWIIGFLNGKQVGLSMLKAWIIANGIFTSLGAILALAHPITIIASWIVSPITSLNPTIGAGIVLGIIEAFFRKPRVKDFERLSEDILSIKGFYKNRITRILLVFILTSVGSSIGTFVGIPWVVSLLGK